MYLLYIVIWLWITVYFHVHSVTTVSGAEENGRPGDSDSDISMFACEHTINLCTVWYIYVWVYNILIYRYIYLLSHVFQLLCIFLMTICTFFWRTYETNAATPTPSFMIKIKKKKNSRTIEKPRSNQFLFLFIIFITVKYE